jgi:hypothetical protein
MRLYSSYGLLGDSAKHEENKEKLEENEKSMKNGK